MTDPAFVEAPEDYDGRSRVWKHMDITKTTVEEGWKTQIDPIWPQN